MDETSKAGPKGPGDTRRHTNMEIREKRGLKAPKPLGDPKKPSCKKGDKGSK